MGKKHSRRSNSGSGSIKSKNKNGKNKKTEDEKSGPNVFNGNNDGRREVNDSMSGGQGRTEVYKSNTG